VDPNSSFPKHFSGEVVLHLAGGRTLSHREQVNRGAGDRPLSAAEVEAKFMENAAFGGFAARAARMRDAVLGLEGADARELEAALGTE
jgi:hypothetical protein